MPQPPDAAALRAWAGTLTGPVILPDDDAFDAARVVWNRAIDGFDHLRDEHQRRHLTAVAAGLGSLRDDQVDASGDLFDRVLLGADQRGDGHAVFAARVDHVVGWHAQCICDELDGVTHRHREQLGAGVAGE